MDNFGEGFSRVSGKRFVKAPSKEWVEDEAIDQMKSMATTLIVNERNVVETFIQEALKGLPYAAINYTLAVKQTSPENCVLNTSYSLEPKESIDISANQLAYTNELETALLTICNALPPQSFLLLGEVFWQIIRAIDKYNIGSLAFKQRLLDALANIAYDPNNFPEYIYDTHSTIRSGRDSEDHESSSKDCR